jgi:hypothetical protein
MKRIVLATLIIMSALVVSAQVSSTVDNTPCYPGEVECNTVVYQNFVDPSGTFLIVFFTGSPSNQGVFSVYESSGTPQVPTDFTPKIVWGYQVGGVYSASFNDPAGRAFTLNFKQINSVRYGLVWVILSTSTINGPSLLIK